MAAEDCASLLPELAAVAASTHGRKAEAATAPDSPTSGSDDDEVPRLDFDDDENDADDDDFDDDSDDALDGFESLQGYVDWEICLFVGLSVSQSQICLKCPQS